MLQSTGGQLLIFIPFFILGAVSAPVFSLGDLIFFKVKKPKQQFVLKHIAFSFFLIILFLTFFYLMLKINFGVFRLFMALGVLFGYFLANSLLLKPLAKPVKKLYNLIRKAVERIKCISAKKREEI